MRIFRFLLLAFLLLLVVACGRTDFDPNFLPDGGTPDIDGDVPDDVDGTTPGCGNGVLEAQLGEECDDGDRNSDEPGARCRTNCRLRRCGDGILDPGESCDEGDGNSDAPGASCRTNCLPQRCGDGVVDPGESCDAGPLNSNEPGSPCRTNCVLPTCGDGIVDPGEECDDNNQDPADSCTNACTQARCGDGVIFTGHEVCDDGNARDDIACDADCQAGCGDGVLEPARGELCDDGAANSDIQPGACRTDCRFDRCGDGIVQAGQFCLGAPLFFPVGAAVVDVAALDLDADGHPDVVITTGASVHVFLYNPATYAFVPTWSRSGLSNPIAPMAADFNGDGNTDLVVVETAQRRVAVFMGQGGGLFAAPVRYSTGTGIPSRAAAADFTGDGRPEIAVVVPYSDQFVILRNNGSGVFSLAPAVSTCTRPVSIAAGILDDDASADIVIACQSANVLALYYGNGDGTFSAESYLGASDKPSHVLISEMNRDGRPDIVLLRAMNNPVMPQLSLYLQTASRSFQAGGLVQNLPYNVRMSAVSDVDRNRTRDVLVSFDNALRLYRNDGTGTLSFVSSYTWPADPGRIAFADFAGDLESMPAIAGGSPLGAVGLDPASWPLPGTITLPAAPQWGALEYITGDNAADGVFLTTDGRLLVLTGTGAGSFSGISETVVSNASAALFFPTSSAQAADVWVHQAGYANMLTLINDGAGNLTPAALQPVAGSAVAAAVSHLNLNNDAYEDAAVLFSDTARIQLFRGSALGGVPGVSLAAGSSPRLMKCGDILGINSSQCVVVEASGSVLLFIPDMNGSGTVVSIGSLGGLPADIALADADADGRLDLVAAFSNGTVSSFSFDVAPGPIVSLAPGEVLTAGCTPRQLIAADVDDNSLLETLLLCNDGATLRLLVPGASGLQLHPAIRTAIETLGWCTAGTLVRPGEFLCWLGSRPEALTLLQRH